MLISDALKKFVELAHLSLLAFLWNFFVLAAFIWFIYYKHTWNLMVNGDSMKWSRGILRKIKSFGSEWQMVFFTCSLLIPEQILWLNIPLIYIYMYWIFHRIYFYRNVVFLALPAILVNFEFIKVSMTDTFWVLLGNWCS